jgi:hypothetical protein
LSASQSARDSMRSLYGSAPGPSRMTNGAVEKLGINSGKWTDITPDHPVAGSREFGYAAVAVDAHYPRSLIASSYNRYSSGGEEPFRSTDGGATWKQSSRTAVNTITPGFVSTTINTNGPGSSDRRRSSHIRPRLRGNAWPRHLLRRSGKALKPHRG